MAPSQFSRLASPSRSHKPNQGAQWVQERQVIAFGCKQGGGRAVRNSPAPPERGGARGSPSARCCAGRIRRAASADIAALRSRCRSDPEVAPARGAPQSAGGRRTSEETRQSDGAGCAADVEQGCDYRLYQSSCLTRQRLNAPRGDLPPMAGCPLQSPCQQERAKLGKIV